MKLMHHLAAKFATDSLVGLAGVAEAVAEHPLAALQGRKYLFVNVLGPVCKHEPQLRHGRQAGGAGIEQHGPQAASEGGPSGLPSDDYVHTPFAQVGSEFLQLS